MPAARAAAVVAIATLAAAEDAPEPRGISPGTDREVVRQRDEAGRVRVHREVALNERGDYVNHGIWRAYDPAGKLTGQGRYEMGRPVGSWVRWADAAPELDTPATRGFPRPLLSRASFRNGKLHGAWEVLAADGRTVALIEFCDGKRHGVASLFAAGGGIIRRQRYVNGRPDGPLTSVSPAGAATELADFENGRQRLVRTERSADGAMVARSAWLGPVQERVEPDDPWRIRLARYEPAGEDLRDGLREAWWPNGQPKLRIEYRLGEAVGEARWWHENGQLALSGTYEAGLAHGAWTWWRSTGLRSAACRYVAGRASDDCSLWAADGVRLEGDAAVVSALRPGLPMVR